MTEHAAPSTPGIQPLTLAIPRDLTIKVLGIGGTGGIVSDYVALWLNILASTHARSSIRLVLLDGDVFEPANTRMHFSAYGNKAIVKRDELRSRLGERLGGLLIDAVDQFVSPENIAQLLHEDDVVLLCVDSHASRKLVSDYFGSRIRNGVLISAGNDGVGPDTGGQVLRGTFGNCQIYIRREGEDRSPALDRYHPEIADPADKLPTDKACTDLVASVPQLLFANFWAAASMLSTLYLALCESGALKYSELVFDFAEGIVRPVDIPGPRMDKQAG